MFEAWVLTPLVLLVLAAGAGLGVRKAGGGVPVTLVPVCGLAALIVYGWAAARIEPGAIVPGSIAIAAIGGLAGLRGTPAPPAGALAAGLAAFGLLAAPIVLFGEATIAGYVKLDDTATWLAITDRVLEAGPTAEGLAPSTHEATLAVNFGNGYPYGGFIPLGVAAELAGTDVAWAFQPYAAFLGTLLAPALWELGAALARSPFLRCAIAVLASQAALLVGFYLWGGIKEVAMATLAASACALIAAFPHGVPGPRAALPFGLLVAATIALASAGGLVWLLPATALLGASLLRERVSRRRLGVGAAVVAAGAAAVLVPGRHLSVTRGSFSNQDDFGNLGDALDPMQVAGVWPASDFRLPSEAEPLVFLAVAALATAAVAATVVLARRGEWPAVAFSIGMAAACIAICAVGSPWLDAKAMAIASPAVLFAGLLGFGLLRPQALRIAAVAGVAALVFWSVVAQWGGTSFAPRDQLEELEEIGEVVAGEGPTLMTEYSPYGARHFLRDADPESVSDLRRRLIPRANGEPVRKGGSADTDELDLGALAVYRTLVLRRSPVQSRPPSPYRLVFSGEFYEAWQRPEGGALPERIALGSRDDPVGEPRCGEVLTLARSAERLIVAVRPVPQVVPLSRIPAEDGAIRAEVSVDRRGDYDVWLGGSVRPAAELRVDGEPSGDVRHELNNLGQYVRLGSARLGPGAHLVEVTFAGADLRPGSADVGAPVGPLALSRGEAADAHLRSVPAEEAERLCGRGWDWIEAR